MLIGKTRHVSTHRKTVSKQCVDRFRPWRPTNVSHYEPCCRCQEDPQPAPLLQPNVCPPPCPVNPSSSTVEVQVRRALPPRPTYLSTHVSTYLPINLPTYRPTYLSSYLRIDLPTYQATYLPINLPTYLRIDLPTYLATYLPINLIIYLPTYLPINLPTYQPNNLPTYLTVERADPPTLHAPVRIIR